MFKRGLQTLGQTSKQGLQKLGQTSKQGLQTLQQSLSQRMSSPKNNATAAGYKEYVKTAEKAIEKK